MRGLIFVFVIFQSVSLFSQETFQTVTERGSVTDRRLGFYAGGSVAYNNLVVDGLTMNYKDPLVIRRNLDYLGLAMDNAAIRFDIDNDAIDGTPTSLMFVYPNSGIPYMRRIGNDHTIFKIWSPRNSDNAYESTLALVNGDGEEEILDLYNMSYPSNHSFGIRMQKRGVGVYKPFHFEYSDGNETYPVFTMNPDKSSYFYGDLSIGTQNSQGYKLAVAGKIISEEVIVKLQNNWPDYVFGADYELRSLGELEDYIKKHKKLPKMPTADEVKKHGIATGETNKLLLEKVEELTLYIIDQNKKLEKMQQEIDELKDK
ncbi:hypothetical protein OOZ15_05330 [Galbibacter sp. EGI 63066]|uniref:hypothetical protein n=1 Tax=Galbibacter sp. EGI 63066 TaxID=2993559 RepID=UPI002248EDC8|nr:hypothetical protein [Galbibacter sp. EGI 63066]MCX2679358.1 hypothetical protein [Galbibacter sp. EGI 63066]